MLKKLLKGLVVEKEILGTLCLCFCVRLIPCSGGILNHLPECILSRKIYIVRRLVDTYYVSCIALFYVRTLPIFALT